MIKTTSKTLEKLTRKCGNCDALQLEAARRRANVSPVQLSHPYELGLYEVGQTIRSWLFTLVLLIPYVYAVTLTSDPLTFNVLV